MKRWGLTAGLVGLLIALSGESAWATHELRKGLTDLLGPNAWALYLIVPVPFLLLGLLGYRIYKALRATDAAQGQADEAHTGGDGWRDER